MTISDGQQQTIELISQLTGLSLLDTEIYVTGISLPPLPVAIFAKRCGITRQNAYNILSRLNDAGLVTNISGAAGRYVQIAPTDNIQRLVGQRLHNLSKESELLPSILSSIEKTKYSGPIKKARVSYFEGLGGIQNLYRKTLQTKEKVLRTLSHEDIFSRLGEDFTLDYIAERKKRGIHNKVIQNKPTSRFKSVYKNSILENRDYRIPPKDMIIDSVIVIYDESVVLITLQSEIFGTHIESTDYSRTMKSWFDTIYTASKPLTDTGENK